MESSGDSHTEAVRLCAECGPEARAQCSSVRERLAVSCSSSVGLQGGACWKALLLLTHMRFPTGLWSMGWQWKEESLGTEMICVLQDFSEQWL